jgi:predicted molibdopterin-dependent oxidoreductase YjgC
LLQVVVRSMLTFCVSLGMPCWKLTSIADITGDQRLGGIARQIRICCWCGTGCQPFQDWSHVLDFLMLQKG